MTYRELGRTGWQVSSISFGAWAIGGTWGTVNDDDSMAALHRALDKGVNLFDTADVYGDGRSERLLARLRRERSEPFRIATKAGRRLSPHVSEGYTQRNITDFVHRSLENLNAETIDLLQLHCPPTEVYYRPEVFGWLDGLVRAGKLLHYGVSVEKVEEALKAIEYPGVQTVQIVYNVFRQRPAELFFAEAARRNVGILVRLLSHRVSSPANSSRTRRLSRTITEHSTDRVRHLIGERHFQVLILRSDSEPSRLCAR